MELIITAGISAGLGAALGLYGQWRLGAGDRERAYLAGHVDGYGKALHDAGVPE